MAAQVEDKTQSMQYLSTCLQQFLMDVAEHTQCSTTLLYSQATATAMGKQHSSTTITSIHLTSTRQGRTFPSNIDGTSESTQATQQHRIHKQASHHAMDGETRSLPVEQECNPRRWQHQLLQALEQGTPNTNL